MLDPRLIKFANFLLGACVHDQLNELSERLREREDRAAGGGAGATTASSSSCNGGGGEEAEAEDDKRNVVLGCVNNMEPTPESCVLVVSCATPADVSVESECDDHHLDYGDGFPESYCTTPELWEPWPLVEWNEVA